MSVMDETAEGGQDLGDLDALTGPAPDGEQSPGADQARPDGAADDDGDQASPLAARASPGAGDWMTSRVTPSWCSPAVTPGRWPT
jgi:hypothetical protein